MSNQQQPIKRPRNEGGYGCPPNFDLEQQSIIKQLEAAASIDLSSILDDNNTSPAIKAILQQQQAANRALLELFKQQQQQRASEEDPAERRERERSVVLIGVPESTQVLASDRYSSDVAAVTSLFNVMGVEPAPIIYRLGRKDNPSFNGRPRLIKAIFPSRQFQYQTLGSWKRHRDTIRQQPQFRNVLIRPSLTLAEREKEREQRALRRETIKGQNNLNTKLTTK